MFIFKIMFLSVCIYVCVHVHVCTHECAQKCRYLWKPEASDFPGAEHTGSCELPGKSARNRTPVLGKNSTSFYLPSHFSNSQG